MLKKAAIITYNKPMIIRHSLGVIMYMQKKLVPIKKLSTATITGVDQLFMLIVFFIIVFIVIDLKWMVFCFL